LEAVLALKPDLIVDIGSTDATYVSLADRVQEQTGIPYALLDGRFGGIAAIYSTLGQLTGRHHQGDVLADCTERTIATIRGASRTFRPTSARRSMTHAGRADWKPGSAARSTSRPSNSSRATWRAAKGRYGARLGRAGAAMES
jgi:hypothetical protein